MCAGSHCSEAEEAPGWSLVPPAPPPRRQARGGCHAVHEPPQPHQDLRGHRGAEQGGARAGTTPRAGTAHGVMPGIKHGSPGVGAGRWPLGSHAPPSCTNALPHPGPPAHPQVVLVQEYAEAGPLAQVGRLRAGFRAARLPPLPGTVSQLPLRPLTCTHGATLPLALCCPAARPSDAGAAGPVLLSADC